VDSGFYLNKLDVVLEFTNIQTTNWTDTLLIGVSNAAWYVDLVTGKPSLSNIGTQLAVLFVRNEKAGVDFPL